jgi:hypothetical protein
LPQSAGILKMQPSEHPSQKLATRSQKNFLMHPLNSTFAFLVSIIAADSGAGRQLGSGGLNWAPDRCPALLRIHLALWRTWL